MTPILTIEQQEILREFEVLRRRREEFKRASREFHESVRADFRRLVARGRAAEIEMRTMCRYAGLSHEMGYRLVREVRDEKAA
jgi:ribosomal protein L32E